MPKRLGGKSFERDLSRIRVTMGNALLPGVTPANYPDVGGIGGTAASNYVAPLYGYDYQTATDLFYGAGGIWMDGTVNTDIYGVWRVPADYSSGTVSISVALFMSSSGTIAGQLNAYRNRCGSNVVPDADSYSAVAVTGSQLNCIFDKQIDTTLSLQAGDIVRLNFDRAGTVNHPSDTGEDGFLVAFLISA